MLLYPQWGIFAMRDIRDDLKERLASITAEQDEMKARENLLSSMQQSLYGLLEEEDRRFRDRVSPLLESTPKSPYSESTPSGLYGTERPKAFSTELPKTVKLSIGSWAGDQRKSEV